MKAKALRHRLLLLTAMAAFIFIVAPACDSPTVPPVEEEPKDDEEPADGMRRRGGQYSIVAPGQRLTV